MNYLYTFLIFVAFSSCTSFVEIGPPVNSITDKTAYQSDATATSVATGLFQDLNNSPFIQGGSGLGLLTGLQSDELTYYLTSAPTLEFATSSLLPDNTNVLGIWTRAYRIIYGANAIIEGVTSSTSLSPHVEEQLIGEAKFMRALMFFYLVNLYGDVPMPLTTDYRVNTALSRLDRDEVYRQIIMDLTDAKRLLKDDYLSATNAVTTHRVRPNKGAAAALLARVYLYVGDWANAESNASEVIAQTTMYQMEANLDNIFLVDSEEAIWQIGFGPNVSGISSYEGYTYILTNNPTTNYPGFTLSQNVMDVLTGDKRREHWTKDFMVGDQGYPYAFKYKVRQGSSGTTPTEHTIMLRVAEQYLIRAEARAMQGNLADGVDDLNVVHLRANELAVEALDSRSFMLALEKERQAELFLEWGHRWFDMKRWKGFDNQSIARADEIMPDIAEAKGGTWEPEFKLWPIPQNERIANVNLDQNPGYGF